MEGNQMRYAIIVLMLSGCTTVIKPADIPQEFTEPVDSVETIIQLDHGLDNETLYVETVPDLIAGYNICQRRHAGLVKAVGIAQGKKL